VLISRLRRAGADGESYGEDCHLSLSRSTPTSGYGAQKKKRRTISARVSFVVIVLWEVCVVEPFCERLMEVVSDS